MGSDDKRGDGVSRRDFLIAGIGAAGIGVAGASLVGCSPKTTEGASTSTSGASTGASSGTLNGKDIPNVAHPLGEKSVVQWSWDVVPDPIEDSEIDDIRETDVLIIGGGWSGTVAAVSAAQQGASVLVSEKFSESVGKGGHIAAFGSKVQEKYAQEGYFKMPDWGEVTRRLIMWCHGRVKEPLQQQWGRKSGACMDWLVDLMSKYGLKVNLWNGYFKGPDYTEVPTAHVFYNDSTDWVYLDGVSTGLGMAEVLPAMVSEAGSLGVEYLYETPALRVLREGSGPVTGAILQDANDKKIKVNAKSVIICAGDYLDDDEMRTRYAPLSWDADVRLYIPAGVNTGDMHKACMWIGAAMQYYEPHALTIHLESGAQSYNFLHVNAEGQRFMNEDVNTQSKSCAKVLQPEKGKTFTIYDANSLQKFADACEKGLAGGISSDQQYRCMGMDFNMDVEMKLRQAKLDQGLLFQADSIEELAQKAGLPADGLKKTVERYNELCAQGRDEDFGKRPEILWPISEPPFFAGQLVSTLLLSYGGLRTDPKARVLDGDNKPIDGLFVAGLSAGEFYGEEYPTIVPGNSLGRALTFGRIAGINAAGGDADAIIPDLKISFGGITGPCSIQEPSSQQPK